MHCLVINIRAQTVRDVGSEALRLGGLSEVLLLVADVVFGACDYTGLLDASYGLGKQHACQDRIRAIHK